MGTWGAGGFENDAAADFAAGIDSLRDIATVLTTLPDDPEREIEADQAQQIIAAAECLAARLGRPAGDMPDDLAAKVATFDAPAPELIDAAKEAVSRVLQWSELTELWAEEDSAPWNIAITSLIQRLNPQMPYDPPKRPQKTEARQTCGFCNKEIAPADLVSIRIGQQTDAVNLLDQGFWCHLRCLNARLHPKHIVQNWKFDPDDIDRMAQKLRDC